MASINDANYWRQRAEVAHAKADIMVTADGRKAMSQVARSYELLAEHTERARQHAARLLAAGRLERPSSPATSTIHANRMREHAFPVQLEPSWCRANGIGHESDNSDEDDGDDELLAIGAAIRAALANGIDPYVLAGLLEEGAAYAVARHIPAGERDKAAAALVVMLHDRLKAYRG